MRSLKLLMLSRPGRFWHRSRLKRRESVAHRVACVACRKRQLWGYLLVDKRKILIQLDSDAHPSVFDRVVAVDAGADELFSYGSVQPEQVRDLVHGAIFTRGPKDLKNTAFFIGGTNVAVGEKLLAEVVKHMIPQFGLRVSVLLDANGANTTAAAAVRAASRNLNLSSTKALVLGGTGPVGQRVALLLAYQGAEVRLGSRQQDRAQTVCDRLRERMPLAKLEAVAIANAADLQAALDGSNARLSRRGRRESCCCRWPRAKHVRLSAWPST